MTDYLKCEKERLTKILRKVRRQLEGAPAGTLKVSTSNGTNQYLLKTETPFYTYISKKDLTSVKEVAQKEYNLKVKKVAEKKLKVIEKLIKLNNPDVVWKEYDRLCPGRKQLVKPVEETREQYEQKWIAVEYEKKNFHDNDKIYETQRGEKVRSKSEALIANILADNKICYRYEYPIQTANGRIIHPDFIVLNSRTHEEFILEHFGLMDNIDYQTTALKKINTYLSSGYVLGKNLLITFENPYCGFNPKQIQAFVNHFFL